MIKAGKMVKIKNKKATKNNCPKYNTEYYEEILLKKRAKHIYSALKMYLTHRMTIDKINN